MDSGSDPDFESVNLSDVEESSSSHDIDTDPSIKPKSKPSTPTKNSKFKAVDTSSQQQPILTQTQTATQQSSRKRLSMSERLATAREARRRRAADSVAEARRMEEEQRQEDAEKRRQLRETANRTQKDKTDKKAVNISNQKQKDNSSVSRDLTPDVNKRITAKHPSTSSPSKAKRVSKKQALADDRRREVERDDGKAQEEETEVLAKKAPKVTKANVSVAAQKEKEKDGHAKVVKSQNAPQSQPTVTVVEPIRKKERPLFGAAKASAERKRKQMEEVSRNQPATSSEHNDKTTKKRKETSAASLNDHSKGTKNNEQGVPSPKKVTKKTKKTTVNANADNYHDLAPSKKRDSAKNPDPKTKKKSTSENEPTSKMTEKRPKTALHATSKNTNDVDKPVSKEKVQSVPQTKKRSRGNTTTTAERKQSHTKVVSSEEEDEDSDESDDAVKVAEKSFSPKAKKSRRVERPNEDNMNNTVAHDAPVEISSDEYDGNEKQSPNKKENGTIDLGREMPQRKVDRRQSMPAYSSKRAGRSQNGLTEKGINMLDALEKEYLLFVQRQDHVIDNFFTDIGVSSNPLQMLNSVMTPIRQFTHAERGFLRDERLQTHINAAKWELRLSLHEKLQEFARKVSTALTEVQKGEASSLRDLMKEQTTLNTPLVTPFKMNSQPLMMKESPSAKRRMSTDRQLIPIDDEDEEMKENDNEDEMEESADEGELKKMTNVAELKEYLGTSYKRLGLNCYRSEVICKLCESPQGMTMNEIKYLTPMGRPMLRGKLNALEGNNLIYKEKVPQKDGSFKTVYITNESIRHLR